MGTPDFAAWGMDGPTAQFGMQLGQSAVAAGQDYVQKNVSGILIMASSLRRAESVPWKYSLVDLSHTRL